MHALWLVAGSDALPETTREITAKHGNNKFPLPQKPDRFARKQREGYFLASLPLLKMHT